MTQPLRRLSTLGVAASALSILTFSPSPSIAETRPEIRLETLDRGVVAAPAATGGVLVSWRLLTTDPSGVAFDVYRDGRKLNRAPLTGGTNLVDRGGRPGARYAVVTAGSRPRPDDRAQATAWSSPYLAIPLDVPAGGVTPDGVAYSYTANDASVGDLDGDGRYEIVLKWDPTNSKDNAHPGFTGNVMLDAYTLDGRKLWRIDLGRNIRAGAHYTQFEVADFDGDGRAEVVLKTADGTRDGLGTVLGDPDADWRTAAGSTETSDRTGADVAPDGRMSARLLGRILAGPEYLTVFDGLTGRALATTAFEPARGGAETAPDPERMKALWGDAYANRSERYLGGVAYLDGRLPSILMARGYYGRSLIAAWDWRDGRLTRRWLFDSTQAPDGFNGQGNHQLSVADVDADGRQEIVYGSMAVDDDGSPLWTARLGHGDAMHVADLDPSRPGLEKFGVHESVRANGGIGAAMLDARTGEILWTTPADRDTGRGVALDIDPRHPGSEAWAANMPNLYSASGEIIATSRPGSMNFGVWWDGDAQRELLDGIRISKWDWNTATTVPMQTLTGAASNNGTKATPALVADILGDWREEIVIRSEDSRELRIYVTPYPTDIRHTTLMQDAQYRVQVAGQNTAYNQPSHPASAPGATETRR